MRSARDGLVALHAALAGEGGPVAQALVAAPSRGHDRPGPAQIAAAGPRARGAADEYELLIDMILEGSRLHYGEAELVRPSEPDLRLLLGDHLYALGLQRLAALGDLPAVAELADIISLAAQAHAEGDRPRAQAVWEAGARAIGWGSDPAHAAAKAQARAGQTGASAAVRGAVRRDGR